MRSSVALWAFALPFFVAIGSASVIGDIHLGLRSSSGCKVSGGYYPGWNADTLPLDQVSWKKYTHMTYAFVETTPTPDEVAIPDGEEEILIEFVAAAKKNCVDALFSLGGWGGSVHFSSSVGSQDNRTRFVRTLTDFIGKYGFDGIDLDWEYPNRQGIGCNEISTNDTSNFYAFLKELRDSVGDEAIITAAAPITPWTDADGNPADMSPFADVLNHVVIMNYDIWGHWSGGVGPNAPLNDTCAAPANQQGSAVSAVQAWTKAGFPKDQLVLGVAAYGHSFLVNNSVALTAQGEIAAYPPFEPEQPMGDSSDGPSVDSCGVRTELTGVFNFRGMIEGGLLDEEGQPLPGIDYRFDECSQTPYVYNVTSQVMISFDDAKSFEAKGRFIAESGLAGHVMWQAAADYHDILIDSVRNGSGLIGL